MSGFLYSQLPLLPGFSVSSTSPVSVSLHPREVSVPLHLLTCPPTHPGLLPPPPHFELLCLHLCKGKDLQTGSMCGPGLYYMGACGPKQWKSCLSKTAQETYSLGAEGCGHIRIVGGLYMMLRVPQAMERLLHNPFCTHSFR